MACERACLDATREGSLMTPLLDQLILMALGRPPVKPRPGNTRMDPVTGPGTDELETLMGAKSWGADLKNAFLRYTAWLGKQTDENLITEIARMPSQRWILSRFSRMAAYGEFVLDSPRVFESLADTAANIHLGRYGAEITAERALNSLLDHAGERGDEPLNALALLITRGLSLTDGQRPRVRIAAQAGTARRVKEISYLNELIRDPKLAQILRERAPLAPRPDQPSAAYLRAETEVIRAEEYGRRQGKNREWPDNSLDTGCDRPGAFL